MYVRHVQINSDHDGKGLYTYYGVISPILHHNPLRESTYPPWSPAPASAPRVPRSSHRARGICRTFVHTRSPYPSAASRPEAPKEEMVERKENKAERKEEIQEEMYRRTNRGMSVMRSIFQIFPPILVYYMRNPQTPCLITVVRIAPSPAPRTRARPRYGSDTRPPEGPTE